MEEDALHLAALGALFARFRQLWSWISRARPTSHLSDTHSRIATNIRCYACCLTGVGREVVPEYAVVVRRLDVMAGTASEHECVRNTILDTESVRLQRKLVWHQRSAIPREDITCCCYTGCQRVCRSSLAQEQEQYHSRQKRKETFSFEERAPSGAGEPISEDMMTWSCQ